ncbi:MAG TPA: cupin [Patescibacteria group bacterium]|nr:cupin [Patescibacteria group bacterium]
MNLPTFDQKSFSNDSYVRRIEKPWGYELHWTPEDLPYMGKLIHINAGRRLSLQLHDKKQESWFLIHGKAKVTWENSLGHLVETELVPNNGYSTQVGQKHRLIAITDCDIIEVSTPEIGTTYRLEDDYKRPDETEEQRKKERKAT